MIEKIALTLAIVALALMATAIPILLVSIAPPKMLGLLLLLTIPLGVLVVAIWIFVIGVFFPEIWQGRS